jgi:hypothetical protein
MTTDDICFENQITGMVRGLSDAIEEIGERGLTSPELRNYRVSLVGPAN